MSIVIAVVVVVVVIMVFIPSFFCVCLTFRCFPCNPRAAVCSDVTGGSVGVKGGGENLSHSSLGGVFKSERARSSLPGLRREVVDLGQVLDR